MAVILRYFSEFR